MEKESVKNLKGDVFALPKAIVISLVNSEIFSIAFDWLNSL
jgi:hypothetical protein